MAEFGWAYVAGSLPKGPSGSVQFSSTGSLSGSENYTYVPYPSGLFLTGTLYVSGAISASSIVTTTQTVVDLTSTGSTTFGTDCSDTHIFTGSILVSCSSTPLNINGLVTGTADSSNSFLALDSNNNVILTSSNAGGLIDEYTNYGNNRVVTSIDSSGINAEANLTFDGSTLTVTGDLTASVGISSSVGQFTEITGTNISSTTVDASTVTATTVTATSLGGTLTTAAQPNITSVGTLGSLTVTGDLTVDTDTLYVDSAGDMVGIGTLDPTRTLELLSTSPQFRLSYSEYVFGVSNDVYSDIYTNADGYLIFSASGDRMGFGTSSPTTNYDFIGDVRVSGNLEVTGTLSATATTFAINADSITFGSSSTDTLIFNGATASIPNDLNFASCLLFLDNGNSKVGIGVCTPDTKLEILSTGDQFKISYDQSNGATLVVDSGGDLNITPTGNAISASSDLYVVGDTVLGSDSTKTTIAAGPLTASVSLSSSQGRFDQLTASGFTNGTVVVAGGDISGVSTLTATNIAGTLTTAAQPNITSVGTLSSLTITGDLTVDTNTLYVDSVDNHIGVGKTDPQKKVEVLDTDTQLRLTYSDYVFGVTEYTYSDISTDATGSLTLSGSGGLTVIDNSLKVNGLSSGTGASTSHYLALDSNNNVVLTSSVGGGGGGGSQNLQQVTDEGNTTTNAMTASALNLTGLIAGTATTSSYLALDSSNNVILTSSAGGSGGTIGPAEDGTYTDGLYTDFVNSTPIGTAIDRFNEILKLIVPGPAPAVDRIDYTNTVGQGLKLSITSSSKPADYVAVDTTGSFTEVLEVNSEYSASTSGEDYRLGTYDGTQEITGVINFNVTEQLKGTEVNYSDNAFGNAESGSLNLYLNGTLLHTLDLNGFAGAGNPNTGSASDLNSSGSGFFEVSVSASATDQNGASYELFQHRTAKYVIDPNDHNKGWNYAKIEHTYGATTYITNFVQWFNDSDASSNSMASTNQRVTFTGNGSKFLSGVEYFRSASLVYNAEVSNVYKYTYPTGNVVTFNRTSNIDAISAQSLEAIGGSEDYTKTLELTASTDTNDDTMLNDSTTISFNLTHPFKSNLSSTGSVTTDEILIYNVDTANTNLTENFDLEDYRIISGAYGEQSAVPAAGNVWDSENHMTASGATGHTDGLMFYNGRLYSPLEGANSSDFSSLTNGPSGNPDYSALTGTRTFYRKIQNTSGADVYDLKITSTKNSKINTTILTTDNVRFYIKIPETTGWMDISSNFTYGSIQDDDGALINGASDNSNTGATDTGNSVHCISFGTASVANNSYLVAKIVADARWINYFDTLQFQLGASDVSAPTQAPTLDDIDANNTGVAAKLSFGTSNAIPDYSDATGSSISLTDYDSNDNYSVSGDRRGIFSSKPTLTGELNEDVSSNGNNYPANAFRIGYSGSLVLEVNGVEVHSVDLSTTLNAISNDFNGNSSGFSVSAVGFSTTSDNIPSYTLPYRTGDYQVGAGDQNVGWNYARVIHRTDSDQVTNYVEWIVDPSGSVDDTVVSTPVLSNFNHPDVYYQSGVGYFASRPSASFEYTGSNFYRNVYYNGSDGVTFGTTTNCSISNIKISGSGLTGFNSAVSQTSMPALNNTADCELTDMHITGTVLFDSLTSISGGLGLFTDYDVSVASTVKHVNTFKSNRTTSTASKTSFMVYSGSIGSTNLNTQEYFNTEDYRIVSGNYVSQSNVTSSGNSWDSSISVNDGGSYPSYNDGMATANGYSFSPVQIGNAGDTRNVDDGGSLQAPSGNPNYSTLSESVRTFYRYFRNETGLAKPTFTVTLYGDANLISKSGAFYTGTLGANKNIQVELKVPFDPAYTGLDDTSTAWGDCIKPYQAGTQPTTDGVGVFNGGGSDLNQTVDGTGRAVAIQLQGSQVRDDQYFVLKISAHEDWTGYLSRIAITY